MSGDPFDEGGLEARRRTLEARKELLRRQAERLRRKLEEQRGKKGGTRVSRGPGRCMRRVVEELERAGGTMTRRELEDALVERGFEPSNILRSVRALRRRYLVVLREGADLDRSTVSLPPPPVPVSDEKISRLLAELGVREVG